jgi:hypothetical protein
MMIEITDRFYGHTVTYPIGRALHCYGVDVVAEALAGIHPSYTARQIDGRGQPIKPPARRQPIVQTICVWCDPPRVIAEEPGTEDREVHGICPECRERVLREQGEHR